MASEDSRDIHGPFLLIVRTRRIFTADRNQRVARDTRMSQHIVGFCNRPSENNLSPTVIVTAAVYRGLGSKLHPKANLSP
jgi:hypothetical protein